MDHMDLLKSYKKVISFPRKFKNFDFTVRFLSLLIFKRKYTMKRLASLLPKTWLEQSRT